MGEKRTFELSTKNIEFDRTIPANNDENIPNIIDENFKLIEATSEDPDTALMEEYNMVSMDDVEDAMEEDAKADPNGCIAEALERSTQLKQQLKEQALKMEAHQ